MFAKHFVTLNQKKKKKILRILSTALLNSQQLGIFNGKILTRTAE